MLSFLSLLLAIIAVALAAQQRGDVVRLQKDLRKLAGELADLRIAGLAGAGMPPQDSANGAEAATATDEAAAGAPGETFGDAGVAAGPWAAARAASEAQIGATATEGGTAPAGDAPAGEASETVVARAPATPKRTLEERVGANWTVWVGGLALALGGVFLVRYTIEAGLLGPRVRLALAALFGLALLAGGEWLRRRDDGKAPQVRNAYVPGILTAAGAVTLFADAYAAHGIYNFIGVVTAFALLAAISLATLALSLRQGPWLAALGLLGADVTPLLVASQSASPRVLFAFLALVLAAATFLAARRRWPWLVVGASFGAAFWALAYVADAPLPLDTPALGLFLVAMVVLHAALWLPVRDSGTLFLQRLGQIAADWSGAILPALAAVAMIGRVETPGLAERMALVALVLVLAAASFLRRLRAPLYASAFAALGGLFVWATARGIEVEIGGVDSVTADVTNLLVSAFRAHALGASLLFLAVAIGGAWRAAGGVVARREWAAVGVVVALGAFCLGWAATGDLFDDSLFGLLALAGAALAAFGAETLHRQQGVDRAGLDAEDALVAGAAVFLSIAIHLLTGSAWTGIGFALAGLALAWAAGMRPWLALRWAAPWFAALALLRIAAEPAIVNELALSKTIVLNWLTPGYGIPAIAAAGAAWALARQRRDSAQRVMEAFAALFALLGAAMLARHAMNGGELALSTGVRSLDEQAVYTLIALGGSMILLRLDGLSPSPVFRYGAMALSYASVVVVVFSHFVLLNPLFTDESTGKWPFVNTLLLGYLLPALLAGAVALQARGKRPTHYVMTLGALAVALAVAWIGLSIRRHYQGEFLGFWKPTTGAETYTYSAAGLLAGVALLVAGVRLNSRMLRIFSAIAVTATVLKVFLIDMAALTGVLRALSFMGLGVVLIGIGMLYQRLLSGSKDKPPTARKPAADVIS